MALIGNVIFCITIFAAVYAPLKLRSYRTNDYTNLSSIYGDETMKIRYNPYNIDGSAN